MTSHLVDRRDKVIEAAAHLFREKGYEKSTVRELAKIVGIQSGSLFHYFKTKDDILFAIMEDNIVRNLATLRSRLENVPSVKDKVRALIRCEIDFIIGESGEGTAVLVYEWRSLSSHNQERILILRDKYESVWMETLNAAKQQGLISGDTHILRHFIQGAIFWTANWYKSHGRLTLDDITDQALGMVLKADV